MKIAITGASGFIGTHVAESLRSNGYETELLHQSDFTDENTEALRRKLSQCSGVINLAGATIAGRWSKKNKKRIYDSRIDTTRKLVDTINSLEETPTVHTHASAIGFYSSTIQIAFPAIWS